jgi:predicted glycosyl hydrolase (DUF1957 family)
MTIIISEIESSVLAPRIVEQKSREMLLCKYGQWQLIEGDQNTIFDANFFPETFQEVIQLVSKQKI